MDYFSGVTEATKKRLELAREGTWASGSVAVVEAALGARLVPRSGATLARRARLHSARIAAVALPAIATATDVEHPPATTAALLAKALLQRPAAPPPTRS